MVDVIEDTERVSAAAERMVLSAASAWRAVVSSEDNEIALTSAQAGMLRMLCSAVDLLELTDELEADVKAVSRQSNHQPGHEVNVGRRVVPPAQTFPPAPPAPPPPPQS